MFLRTFSFADQIILKNKNELSGIVVYKNNKIVKFESAHGEISLPLSSIAKIITNSADENNIIRAEIYAKTKRLPSAILSWKKILGGTYSPEKLQASMISLKIDFKENIESLTPEEKKNMVNFLLNINENNKNNYEYILFASEIVSLLGDVKSSIYLLSFVPDEYLKSIKNEDKKEELTKCFMSQIKDLLKNEDYEDALIIIDMLNKYDEDIGISCKVLLYIKMANRRIDDGDYDSGFKIYVDSIYPSSPVIAKNRILNQLKIASENLTTEKNYDTAIYLYKTYGSKIAPEESSIELKILYKDYADYLFQIQQYDKAIETYTALKNLDNSPEIDKLINRCKYQKARSIIAENDYLAHYRLAEQCAKWEIYDEADAEFQIATNHKDLKNNALMQIKIIDEKRSIESLKKCYNLYKENKYQATLDSLLEFKKNFPKSDLMKDADELGKVCNSKIKQEFLNDPIKSQILYQRAEQNFYAGKYAEALDLLELIIIKYDKREIANKAQQLKNLTYKKILFDKHYANNASEDDMKNTETKDNSTTDSLQREINKIIQELKITE